jgi:hypothetical protein
MAGVEGKEAENRLRDVTMHIGHRLAHGLQQQRAAGISGHPAILQAPQSAQSAQSASTAHPASRGQLDESAVSVLVAQLLELGKNCVASFGCMQTNVHVQLQGGTASEDFRSI